MLRVTLIGPGDIEFHYYNLLGISQEKFYSELKKIAKSLAQSNVELELLPDRGVCLELARKFKEHGGARVIGSAPISDQRYGISHLKPQMEEMINGKKLFEEFIDTQDWRDQYRLKGLMGDLILYLGISPGAETELNYAVYLFKLMKGFKENVELKGVHSDMRAGKNIPYTILIYSPFIKNRRFSAETEMYMKKFGISYYYIKNPRQLKQRLTELNSLFS